MITRQLAAEVSDTLLPGKATKLQLVTTVPQTDTGARDEYSKALERTREKGCWRKPAAVKWPERLFTKNTGLRKVVRRRMGADACPVPEG